VGLVVRKASLSTIRPAKARLIIGQTGAGKILVPISSAATCIRIGAYIKLCRQQRLHSWRVHACSFGTVANLPVITLFNGG